MSQFSSDRPPSLRQPRANAPRIFRLTALACLALLTTHAATAATLGDLLNAMPAQSTADQAALCDQLIKLGPKAIGEVCAQLRPSATGGDMKARYAISGLAKHASRPGAEKDRALVSRALSAALLESTDPEVGAFLLEQLQFVAGDEAVDAAALSLRKEALAPTAAMLLAAIHSPGAAAALESALPDAAPVQRAAIENALRSVPPASVTTQAVSAPPSTEAPQTRAALDDLRELAASGKATEAAKRIEELLKERIAPQDDVLRAEALAIAETLEGRAIAKRFLRMLKPAPPAMRGEIWRMLVRRGDVVIPKAEPIPDSEGFVPLFNGVDLTGWTGSTRGYAAENGELQWLKGGKNLFTKDTFADFALRFEFKLAPGSNNGIGLRVPPGGHAAYDGMEIQILDDDADQYKDLKPYQYHGSVYGIVPAMRGHLKPVGEWNTQEIIANGHRITVILNGATIVDADIAEASRNGTPDEKDHPGLLNPQGHIVLLGHNTPITFRNLRVKLL